MPHTPSRRSVKPILAGLVVAVLGMVLTVAISRNQGNAPAVGGVDTGGTGATRTAVVARMAIPQASKITIAELTTETVASNLVPANALTNPSDAVGDYAAIDIAINQVLSPAMLAAVASTGAVPINPITLKDDNVAIAIPNDTLRGAGGFIQQGDHIDILVDTNGQGSLKYVFQDVPILKAGSAAHAEGIADMLLVELPRRQAEEMALILNAKGTAATVVKYALRPSSQDNKGYLASGPDVPPGQPDAADPPMTADTFNNLFNK